MYMFDGTLAFAGRNEHSFAGGVVFQTDAALHSVSVAALTSGSVSPQLFDLL